MPSARKGGSGERDKDGERLSPPASLLSLSLAASPRTTLSFIRATLNVSGSVMLYVHLSVFHLQDTQSSSLVGNVTENAWILIMKRETSPRRKAARTEVRRAMTQVKSGVDKQSRREKE